MSMTIVMLSKQVATGYWVLHQWPHNTDASYMREQDTLNHLAESVKKHMWEGKLLSHSGYGGCCSSLSVEQQHEVLQWLQEVAVELSM